MLAKNLILATLLFIFAGFVDAQTLKPPAPGYLIETSPSTYSPSYRIQGNYESLQASWDACIQIMRSLHRTQAEIDSQCGKTAPTNSVTYRLYSGGNYTIQISSVYWESYYLQFYFCPNNNSFQYIDEENKCTGVTKLGPRPTPKDNGLTCDQPTCGNPVVMGRGTKVQIETDYKDDGPGSLSITRTYNGGIYGVVPEITVGFGAQWTFMAYRRLVMKPAVPQYTCYQRSDNNLVFCRQQASADGSITISAVRPDGKIYTFAKNANGWTSDSDVSETLTPILAADGLT